MSDTATLRARIEAAKDEVVRLCEPGERFRMSIPANVRRDSDLILMDGLNAADELLSAAESPASTTAADAWDEGHDAGWNNGLDTPGNRRDRRVNPYRVAAPAGDGGDE